MKKRALLNLLEKKLEDKKDYAYLVIDLRPGKEAITYHAWFPEKLQSTSPPPKIKKTFRYYLSRL